MPCLRARSVLNALVKLANKTGEVSAWATGRTIEWLRSNGTAASFEAVTIRATSNTGSVRQPPTR